jgi:hypothetical protein
MEGRRSNLGTFPVILRGQNDRRILCGEKARNDGWNLLGNFEG